MTVRRFSPFAEELGEIPLEGGGTTVSATLAADWGGWTAASTATVHTPIPAVLTADWGGWTAASTATVVVRVEAVLTADWGAWDAQMAATASSPPVSAILTADWGGWNGALNATVIPRIESVLTATWGGWTASMETLVIHRAILAGSWGAWAAAMEAVVRPPNDPFSQAITLVEGVPTTGTNVNASAEVDERGDNCPSVWWKYTPPSDETITISLAGSGFSTILEVFTGSLLALTLIDSGTTTVTFDSTGGTTYYIRVTGVACATGSINISLTSDPVPPVMSADWGGAYFHLFARPHTPPRTSALVPYTLGCGIYEAYIKTRGGYAFVGRARNITGLKWSRVINDVSEAEITFALNGVEGECCDLAATINPWEHELSIYRDGAEVWCGPITGGEIDLNGLTATFQAKDLSAWFDHRWIEVTDNDVEFEDADITELFNWLLAHGYWKDPFNLEWTVGEKLNVPINRTYISFSDPERWGGVYQNIATELRDLVGAKIDYTTVRRILVAGDLQRSSRTHPIQLLDQDWEQLPKVKIVGSGMATEQAVAGGNGGYYGYADDQMWIERPQDAYREQFGLLQALDSYAEMDDVDTYDMPNAIAQKAFELREIRKKPFIYLNGGVMSRHAPILVEQLVPGYHFLIALNQTCRNVRANYLLTRLDVTFDGEAEGIALELVPPGADMLKG